jgi:hypothetical protein
MYRVYYYDYNKVTSRDFASLQEAFNFWGRLPFQSFREMVKV